MLAGLLQQRIIMPKHLYRKRVIRLCQASSLHKTILLPPAIYRQAPTEYEYAASAPRTASVSLERLFIVHKNAGNKMNKIYYRHSTK